MKTKPALARAIAHLQEAASYALGRPDRRLPPVVALARSAGVAPATMMQAVRRLDAEGVVSTRRGSGIFAGGTAGSEALPGAGETSSRVKHMVAAVRIRSDIVNAVYPPDSLLPSAKELGKLYGVSQPTLRKTLGILVSQKILRPHSAGFRVASPPVAGGRGTIILVTVGTPDGRPALYVPRTRSYLHTLEEECARTGLDFTIVLCNYEGEMLDPGALRKILKTRPVLGFMIWTAGIVSANLQHLLDKITGLEKPVSILHETGDPVMPTFTKRCPMKWFSLAISPVCGMVLGRHLIAMGHRHVAFVSPFHDSPWSRARLQGLRTAYTEAGIRNGVMAVTAELYATLRPEENTLIAEQVGSELRATLRPRLPQGGAFGGILTRVERHLLEFTNRELLAMTVSSLIRDIVRKRDFTALVCVNDDVALDAMDRLKQTRLTVPGDLSVAGFDDTDQACLERLTSYNFNGVAVIRAMIGFVLNPYASGLPASSLVELDGFVVQRDSVSRIA